MMLVDIYYNQCILILGIIISNIYLQLALHRLPEFSLDMVGLACPWRVRAVIRLLAVDTVTVHDRVPTAKLIMHYVPVMDAVGRNFPLAPGHLHVVRPDPRDKIGLPN